MVLLTANSRVSNQ